MSLDESLPDATSGDPGCEFHKIPAPQAMGLEALAKRLSKRQITALAALAAGDGVREAAKSSGVGRTTVYKWLKQDPHFRAALNAWKQELLESGRARLLKGTDAAITTLLKSIASGDARSAVALLKGTGMLAAPPVGLTDPAMINREMELDRRQQRVGLAARSHEIAQAESDHLRLLTYLANEEESRRRAIEREEHRRQEQEEERRQEAERLREERQQRRAQPDAAAEQEDES